jgi:hypothetical protein
VGGTTLRSVGHIHCIQRLLDNYAEYVTAQDMLAELREDNKQLTGILRQVHVTCEAYNDVATTSLVENWIDEEPNDEPGFFMKRDVTIAERPALHPVEQAFGNRPCARRLAQRRQRQQQPVRDTVALWYDPNRLHSSLPALDLAFVLRGPSRRANLRLAGPARSG